VFYESSCSNCCRSFITFKKAFDFKAVDLSNKQNLVLKCPCVVSETVFEKKVVFCGKYIGVNTNPKFLFENNPLA